MSDDKIDTQTSQTNYSNAIVGDTRVNLQPKNLFDFTPKPVEVNDILNWNSLLDDDDKYHDEINSSSIHKFNLDLATKELEELELC